MLVLCTMQSLTGELVNIDLHVRRNDDIVDDKQGFTLLNWPDTLEGMRDTYGSHSRMWVRLEPGKNLIIIRISQITRIEESIPS